MPKGRPGGNPDISKHGFKQKFDWDEPCSEVITLRVPPWMKTAIKSKLIENWQELVRQMLAQLIRQALADEDQVKRPTKN